MLGLVGFFVYKQRRDQAEKAAQDEMELELHPRPKMGKAFSQQSGGVNSMNPIIAGRSVIEFKKMRSESEKVEDSSRRRSSKRPSVTQQMSVVPELESISIESS